MKTHPLITTLKNLTGNARGCTFTEPLWGIPYNLFAPYVSVYMLSLGMNDSQIGLLLTIGWGMQIVTALLSGVITDKLGRKRTTLISDLVCWSVPCLIWAVAQNFWYFLAAAIINGMWRVSHNSWTCLLVEDTDPGLLLDIYSWIYIANLISGFFAPITGLLLEAYNLVPTMRGLYILAFVMMTTKFILMNHWVTETRQGRVRMQETRGQSVFAVLREYGAVLKEVIHTPQTIYTAALMVVMSICTLISGNFWAIIVTERMHIPAQDIALYPFVKSTLMLLIYFFVTPRIAEMHFRKPLVAGLAGFLLSQVVLVLAPEKGYGILLVSVALEACSFALVNPQLDRLVVLTVNPKERARIQSLLYVAVITLTSPFGWIAGTLSSIDKTLPFLLNIGLFAVGGGLAFLAGRASKKVEGAASAEIAVE